MAAPSPSLAEACSTFSLALFRTLSEKDKTANIFCSPFSISSALAMVLLGARGHTAAEMSKVLGFRERPEDPEGLQVRMETGQSSSLSAYLCQCLAPPSAAPAAATADEVHAKFSELLSELNKAYAPYALRVANRLYGEQSVFFLQEFQADIKKYYGAELESVDFRTNAEGARVRINTWVEKKTQGKIKGLLGRDALSQDTRLVLVNAIHFKAKWSKPFWGHKTVDFTFRLSKNHTKPVSMMCRERSTFPYRDVPEVRIQVLEMFYKNRELSMILLLPYDIEDDSTGLERLEKELTHETFVDWTGPDRMDFVKVDVKIPKFKLAETYDLTDVLEEMGMSDAFTSESDLSGTSPQEDLVLSKVVHKASVEVNEKGTEAAASFGDVAVEMCYLGLPSFIADHPFLFFIRHNRSRSVLFSGRCCSPE